MHLFSKEKHFSKENVQHHFRCFCSSLSLFVCIFFILFSFDCIVCRENDLPLFSIAQFLAWLALLTTLLTTIKTCMTSSRQQQSKTKRAIPLILLEYNGTFYLVLRRDNARRHQHQDNTIQEQIEKKSTFCWKESIKMSLQSGYSFDSFCQILQDFSTKSLSILFSHRVFSALTNLQGSGTLLTTGRSGGRHEWLYKLKSRRTCLCSFRRWWSSVSVVTLVMSHLPSVFHNFLLILHASLLLLIIQRIRQSSCLV